MAYNNVITIILLCACMHAYACACMCKCVHMPYQGCQVVCSLLACREVCRPGQPSKCLHGPWQAGSQGSTCMGEHGCVTQGLMHQMTNH